VLSLGVFGFGVVGVVIGGDAEVSEEAPDFEESKAGYFEVEESGVMVRGRREGLGATSGCTGVLPAWRLCVCQK